MSADARGRAELRSPTSARMQQRTQKVHAWEAHAWAKWSTRMVARTSGTEQASSPVSAEG